MIRKFRISGHGKCLILNINNTTIQKFGYVHMFCTEIVCLNHFLQVRCMQFHNCIFPIPFPWLYHNSHLFLMMISWQCLGNVGKEQSGARSFLRNAEWGHFRYCWFGKRILHILVFHNFPLQAGICHWYVESGLWPLLYMHTALNRVEQIFAGNFGFNQFECFSFNNKMVNIC